MTKSRGAQAGNISTEKLRNNFLYNVRMAAKSESNPAPGAGRPGRKELRMAMDPRPVCAAAFGAVRRLLAPLEVFFVAFENLMKQTYNALL